MQAISIMRLLMSTKLTRFPWLAVEQEWFTAETRSRERKRRCAWRVWNFAMNTIRRERASCTTHNRHFQYTEIPYTEISTPSRDARDSNRRNNSSSDTKIRKTSRHTSMDVHVRYRHTLHMIINCRKEQRGTRIRASSRLFFAVLAIKIFVRRSFRSVSACLSRALDICRVVRYI